MKNEHSSLNNVLDIKKWQSLQDSLSLVTKMALITIDYKGTPVTDHSSCCDFCRRVRENPKLLPYCKKCDSRGGLEAVRANKPYIYYCHFNIVDVAIPIIIDDKYIGAIMAGQVKLPPDEDTDELEHILNPAHSDFIREQLSLLETEHAKIPELSYEQIKTISDMLFHLCNYIVEESLEKKLKTDMFTAILQDGKPLVKSGDIGGFGVENIKRVRREVSNTLVDVYVSNSSQNNYTLTSPLLQPAFDYIHQHKSENVSLKTASDACHISPSYFSRVFLKETGENFTNYLSKLKILWAKELLETTDMSINQISDALGFNDSGYLIKKFKAFTGVTPAVYRKNPG